MATSTINISIPENLKAEVDEIVATEGYGNTSEFFRDLVRTYLRRKRQEKLEELLLEGINSGDAGPLTREDFEAIKERGLKRLKDRAGK
jgi:antitoxin ParD1/3/4